jgi:hypothetical protein
MRARRAELDEMTIEEAAHDDDDKQRMSPTTWLNMEHGRPSRERSWRRVERRLGWMPGSCEAVLHGGRPQLDPVFEAARLEAKKAKEREAAAEQIVVVDLSVPRSPVIVLAAGGEEGVSEVTRRALLAMATKALDKARQSYDPAARRSTVVSEELLQTGTYDEDSGGASPQEVVEGR